MENSQQKRNFVPLLVLLIIIGVLIASVSKPMQKSTSSDLTDTSGNSQITIPTNPLTIFADSSTTFETICQTTWPTTAGQSGVPNIPDFGKGEHVCGNPNAKIIIEGHACNSCGSERYNLDLSNNRALAIKDKIIQNTSINADNISVFGCGTSHLIVHGGRSEQSPNRRVEIFIVN